MLFCLAVCVFMHLRERSSRYPSPYQTDDRMMSTIINYLPVPKIILFSADSNSSKFVSLLKETLQSIALPLPLTTPPFLSLFNCDLKLFTALINVSIFRCKLALHSKSTLSRNWKSRSVEFRSLEGTCSIRASFTWKNEVRISSDRWQCMFPGTKCQTFIS